MFTKKPEKEMRPPDLARSSPRVPPSAPTMQRSVGVTRPGYKSSSSIIGADLTIIGNLFSKGEVQVDGEIQGELHGMHIVVGESGRMTGAVVADEVVVRGTVMGTIRGKRVALQSSSRFEGDIHHQTLAIEQGAYFEGKSRRCEDPMAGGVRPEATPTGLTGTAPKGPAF